MAFPTLISTASCCGATFGEAVVDLSFATKDPFLFIGLLFSRAAPISSDSPRRAKPEDVVGGAE
jgi:hypothetical protein